MIENSRNVYEAQFSLIICNETLDFEALSCNIGLTPSRVIKNGERISRLPDIVSNEDAWYYTIQLSNPEGSDTDFLKILTTIKDIKVYLNSLDASGHRITLRLSVTTEKAYMGYRLNPDTLKAILDTGFPLDITTVSWGEI